MTSVDPVNRRLVAMTQRDLNVNANKPSFDTVAPDAHVALKAAGDSHKMLTYNENTIVHELATSAKKPFHRWREGRNLKEEVYMTAIHD